MDACSQVIARSIAWRNSSFDRSMCQAGFSLAVSVGLVSEASRRCLARRRPPNPAVVPNAPAIPASSIIISVPPRQCRTSGKSVLPHSSQIARHPVVGAGHLLPEPSPRSAPEEPAPGESIALWIRRAVPPIRVSERPRALVPHAWSSSADALSGAWRPPIVLQEPIFPASSSDRDPGDRSLFAQRERSSPFRAPQKRAEPSRQASCPPGAQ